MGILEDIKQQYDHFKPHTCEGLHMTFVYLGDNLSYHECATYVDLFNQVERIEWKFEFEGYSLFPPGKNNLIIAKFRAPPALLSTRTHIVDQIGPSKLKDEDPYKWIPHITLGKLVGRQRRVETNFAPISPFTAESFILVNPYHLTL
mgnify:CR=1 FL=1